MFYTESFLDEHAYLGKGYIWHFIMTWNKKECLFCFICEDKVYREKDEIESVLKTWFCQTLSYFLEKGAVEIQRELNRFAAWLTKWNGEGRDVKGPIMYLYVQGNLYSNEKNNGVYARCRGHRGVIWSRDAVSDEKMAEDMINYLGEFLVTEKNSPEETANQLKRDMLVAMSRCILKQGYFILWEADDDFQTR